jgi:alkaline phosphatase D
LYVEISKMRHFARHLRNKKDSLMQKINVVFILATFLALGSLPTSGAAEPVHMANGIKIGEVTSSSAIVWVRLTRNADRKINGKPFPKNNSKKRVSLKYDNLDAMEGAVPGSGGEVRIVLSGGGSTNDSGWVRVKSQNDFIYQKRFSNLHPATQCRVTAEGRGLDSETADCKVEGAFGTAATEETASKIIFTVVTGQDYPRRDDPANGHRIGQHGHTRDWQSSGA